jgi:hypothetical protein
MSSRVISAALAWFSLASLANAAPNVERDVADLEQLVSEVKKIVPAGWNLKFDVGEFYLRETRPVLTITSAEDLPVQHFGPGMPAGDPPIEREKVTLWLAFMAYKSPAEHAAARARNNLRTYDRREFVKQRLKGVKFGGKGEDPPAPFQFSPQSAQESRLVREYAFLWLATEPEPLPSHHYGTLSMWYWGEDTIEIHDAERDKQYRQIAKGLERIVTAYEKEPKTSDDDSNEK